MYDLAGSDLRPPVPFIQMLAVTVFPEVKLVGYLVIKRFMVLLQGQDIILTFDNLFSDCFLAPIASMLTTAP
nr:hypothetical protein [Mucilaginibacter rubeus]